MRGRLRSSSPEGRGGRCVKVHLAAVAVGIGEADPYLAGEALRWAKEVLLGVHLRPPDLADGPPLACRRGVGIAQEAEVVGAGVVEFDKLPAIEQEERD